MTFDRSRARFGLVHEEKGVITWHPRRLPRHDQEAAAEAAKEGVPVVVREALDWSAVPDGYSGPLTIDESGAVAPLELSWLQEELAQEQAAAGLTQQMLAGASAAIERLDAMISDDWPVLPAEVRQRAMRDIRWLARHQRRLLLLVTRTLLQWRPTSEEAPPEPDPPEDPGTRIGGLSP